MLQEAVSSVLSQTFQDWELIVVDDAGPGKLPSFSDPRMSVLTNLENRGKGLFPIEGVGPDFAVVGASVRG